MKKIISVLLMLFLSSCPVFADNTEKAKAFIEKAKSAKIPDAKYDYLHRARKLYLEDYDENPVSIPTLVGLSHVAQMLQDRPEAKLYIYIAYNLEPENPYIQKEMGDFFYSFQEYTTALEYYKLALSNGLLKDSETNLKTAKCYEKLGDSANAELYYKITGYVNPSSKSAAKKLNAIESEKKPDDSQKLDNAKYKYLFKTKKPSEEEQAETDAENIINELNSQ